MNILISSWGSTGDVLPPIAVGSELVRRGHQVAFLGNPYHAALVEQAGLTMIPVGRAADHERMMSDKWLMDVERRSADAILSEYYYPLMEDYRRAAAAAIAGGARALVGGEIGSVTAAEAAGLPWLKVAASPGANSGIESSADPLHPERLLPRGWRWLAASGAGLALYYRLHWLRRGRWRVPARQQGEMFETPAVAEFRRHLGLPATVLYRPRASLCMWPEWFAAPRPDWPSGSVVCGFPLYPRPAASTPVATGPVVVTSGSVASAQDLFYEKAIHACRQLGREAVLVTPHREHVPATLPQGIRYVPHAPFHELLGKAVLVIHHGGIGTASYALAAGVPQLLMPLRGDQFDNANRLQRLGVARMLSAQEHDAEQVTAAVRYLLASARVARRCRQWRQRTVVVQGLARAAESVESICQEPDDPPRVVTRVGPVETPLCPG